MAKGLGHNENLMNTELCVVTERGMESGVVAPTREHQQIKDPYYTWYEKWDERAPPIKEG